MAATPGSLLLCPLPAHVLVPGWMAPHDPSGRTSPILTTLSYHYPGSDPFPFPSQRFMFCVCHLFVFFPALSWVPVRQGLRLFLTIAPVWTQCQGEGIRASMSVLGASVCYSDAS